MTLLAHISDLHLNAPPRSVARVRRAVDYLCALPSPPDALLVTGDIADRGDAAGYAEAARLLELPFPVLACPGNHDERAALRTGLLGLAPSTEPVNHARRIGDVTVLMCDSSVPGRAHGLLEPATLAWIDEQLSDPDDQGPALLALHHPPVRVGHPLPDSEGLSNIGDLAALIERHPRVIAVLAGHAHTGAAAVLSGRPVLLAPGVTWTLVIPPQPDRLADLEAPVGVALHLVEDGAIITHFRAIPDGWRRP
jgi:3',5'-cyclic AMP phosphodiesterase CpdA